MEGSATQVWGAFALIVLAVVSLLALVVMVISYVWMYRDAEQRGKPGCLVVLVMLLFAVWPLNLIVWLVCRPPLPGGPPPQPQQTPQPPPQP
jgi:hypothetical protein